MEFFNRAGDNLTRRKLKIISQTPTEIIADIERADSNVVETGTPIKAEVFNGWDATIQAANANAINAITASNSALTESGQAMEKSSSAMAVSNEAISLAKDAINAVADSGTRVKIKEVTQSTINFTADPQLQINSKVSLSGAEIITGEKQFVDPIKTSGINNLGGRDNAIKTRALNGADETGNDGELFINHTSGQATYFNGINETTSVKIDNGNINARSIAIKDNVSATNLNLSGNIQAANVAIKGAFSALTDINGFSFSDTTNVGLELGRRDGTGGTPYIDFHTDGQANTDFNSRIIAESNYLNVSAAGGLKINGEQALANKASSLSSNSPVGYVHLSNGLKIAYGSGKTNSWSTFPNAGTGSQFSTTPAIVVSCLSGGWEAANASNQQTNGFTPNHRYDRDCRYIAIGY